MRSTMIRAAAGSSRKPSRFASATRTAGISRAFGAANSWTSPPAALTAFASFAGALSRAIRTTVRSGGSSPSASATAVELLVAPALDAVGEQVAARLRQRHRRYRAEQRLVIGRPPTLAGLEDLERRDPPLTFGACPQTRPGGVDLGAVSAGDQVERAHLLGHPGRVYSPLRAVAGLAAVAFRFAVFPAIRVAVARWSRGDGGRRRRRRRRRRGRRRRGREGVWRGGSRRRLGTRLRDRLRSGRGPRRRRRITVISVHPVTAVADRRRDRDGLARGLCAGGGRRGGVGWLARGGSRASFALGERWAGGRSTCKRAVALGGLAIVVGSRAR